LGGEDLLSGMHVGRSGKEILSKDRDSDLPCLNSRSAFRTILSMLPNRRFETDFLKSAGGMKNYRRG